MILLAFGDRQSILRAVTCWLRRCSFPGVQLCFFFASTAPQRVFIVLSERYIVRDCVASMDFTFLLIIVFLKRQLVDVYFIEWWLLCGKDGSSSESNGRLLWGFLFYPWQTTGQYFFSIDKWSASFMGSCAAYCSNVFCVKSKFMIF